MRSNHDSQVLPPSRGAKDQVVRADDVAVVRVGEPDVEERLVGALLLVALRLGEQLLCVLRRRLAPRPCAPSLRSGGRWRLRPLSCSIHVSPPSAVCRITPSWPTAQPCLSSTKNTAVRSELTGTLACFQLAAAVGRIDDVTALADRDEPVAGLAPPPAAGCAPRAGIARRRVEQIDEAGAGRRRRQRRCSSDGERGRACGKSIMIRLSISALVRRDAVRASRRVGRYLMEKPVSARRRRRAPPTTRSCRVGSSVMYLSPL